MRIRKKSIRDVSSKLYHKTISLPFYLMIVLLLLCVSAGMMRQLEQIIPSGRLFGLYQSQPFSSTYYNARFFHNEFKIERLKRNHYGKKELVLEGSYEHIKDNLYLLKPEDPTKNVIVVLGKRNFYFYDRETDSIPRFYSALKR